MIYWLGNSLYFCPKIQESIKLGGQLSILSTQNQKMCFPGNNDKCRSLNSVLSLAKTLLIFKLLIYIDQFVDSAEVLPIFWRVHECGFQLGVCQFCLNLGLNFRSVCSNLNAYFFCGQDNFTG